MAISKSQIIEYRRGLWKIGRTEVLPNGMILLYVPDWDKETGEFFNPIVWKLYYEFTDQSVVEAWLQAKDWQAK